MTIASIPAWQHRPVDWKSIQNQVTSGVILLVVGWAVLGLQHVVRQADTTVLLLKQTQLDLQKIDGRVTALEKNDRLQDIRDGFGK
jgi:hypothetical protein